MKNRFPRLAAAAAVVLAMGTVLYLATSSPDGSSVAWAIEQSTQALNEVRTVHIGGSCTPSFLGVGDNGREVKFDLWARKGETSLQSGELRFETADGLIIVVQGNTSYMYDPPENTVTITDGQRMVLSPWIAGELFEMLKEKTEDWEVSYGKDERTGPNCAFVTCSYRPMSRWWRFAFDLQTKLLVRFQQWHSPDREAIPAFSSETITYDIDLDDDLFEFDIPQGAKVIDKRKQSGETK